MFKFAVNLIESQWFTMILKDHAIISYINLVLKSRLYLEANFMKNKRSRLSKSLALDGLLTSMENHILHGPKHFSFPIQVLLNTTPARVPTRSVRFTQHYTNLRINSSIQVFPTLYQPEFLLTQ